MLRKVLGEEAHELESSFLNKKDKTVLGDIYITSYGDNYYFRWSRKERRDDKEKKNQSRQESIG